MADANEIAERIATYDPWPEIAKAYDKAIEEIWTKPFLKAISEALEKEGTNG
jgi:hypothetical protein